MPPTLIHIIHCLGARYFLDLDQEFRANCSMSLDAPEEFHGFVGGYYFIYSSLSSVCNHLGYERSTPHIFLTDTSIHSDTSGALEIILTDPIYRLVAGGEISSWTKPSCDISPRGDIPKNRCPR
jgi:hypothetical protein